MKQFRHINVYSIEEALDTLKEYNGSARIIAGGTDILGVLKDQVLPNYPEVLVNIKTVPGLNRITEDEEGLKIGSLATLSELAKSPLIRERYKVLAQAAHAVGTPQLRNMGTIGGNLLQDTRCWYYRYPHSIGGRLLCLRKGEGPCLAVSGDNRYHAIFGGKKCFAACPSDIAPALLLLNAEVKTAAIEGSRKIPIQELYTSLGNILEPGEIISEILVPEPPADNKQVFIKYTIREPVDFALVSTAALIVQEDGICSESRIVLGAVAPGPLRAFEAEQVLKNKTLLEGDINEAADLAVKGAKPLSMNAYKVELTRTLVARALSEVID